MSDDAAGVLSGSEDLAMERDILIIDAGWSGRRLRRIVEQAWGRRVRALLSHRRADPERGVACAADVLAVPGNGGTVLLAVRSLGVPPSLVRRAGGWTLLDARPLLDELPVGAAFDALSDAALIEVVGAACFRIRIRSDRATSPGASALWKIVPDPAADADPRPGSGASGFSGAAAEI